MLVVREVYLLERETGGSLTISSWIYWESEELQKALRQGEQIERDHLDSAVGLDLDFSSQTCARSLCSEVDIRRESIPDFEGFGLFYLSHHSDHLRRARVECCSGFSHEVDLTGYDRLSWREAQSPEYS